MHTLGEDTAGTVVVVGAGIAGLAAAFRLQQAGHPVAVLERAAQSLVGGRMATVERGGFHIDLGAPLLALRYRRMLELIADLGMADEVLPAFDVVGVARNGLVHRGRTGSVLRTMRGGLLTPVPWTDSVRVLADLVRRRRSMHPADMTGAAQWDTESLVEYATRRRLQPQTLEHFLDPLASILCLDEPTATPATASLLFFAFLLSSGGLFTSARGSGFLPQALAARLPVTYDATVTHLEQRDDEVHVSYSCPGIPETTLIARDVIVTVPPPSLAALCPQLPRCLTEAFAATAYSRLVQVTFCLDRTTTERAVLVSTPRGEAPDVAGFVLQHNLTRARVARGGMVTTYLRGAASDTLWDDDDDGIVDHVLAAIRQLRILPEVDHHSLAVHVDRISPCVVRRRPGEYRRLARAVSARGNLNRIHWAGGDNFGYSTTIGSLTAGQNTADQLITASER